MTRQRSDPHGDIAQSKVPYAMYTRRTYQTELCDGFLHDTRTLAYGEVGVCLIPQRMYPTPLVFIAHAPFKCDQCAGAFIRKVCGKLRRV
jgi:hypothetical protein